MKNNFRKTTTTTLKGKIKKLEKKETALKNRIEKNKADKKRGYLLVPISKGSTTNKRVNLSSSDKKSMKIEIIDAETDLLEVQDELIDNRLILDVELGLAKNSFATAKKTAKKNISDRKAKHAIELLELATKNGSKEKLIKISGKMNNENFTPPMFMKDMRPILNKYRTPRQRPIKSVSKSLAEELMEKVKKIK